jgi:hypothetical protein
MVGWRGVQLNILHYIQGLAWALLRHASSYSTCTATSFQIMIQYIKLPVCEKDVGSVLSSLPISFCSALYKQWDRVVLQVRTFIWQSTARCLKEDITSLCIARLQFVFTPNFSSPVLNNSCNVSFQTTADSVRLNAQWLPTHFYIKVQDNPKVYRLEKLKRPNGIKVYCRLSGCNLPTNDVFIRPDWTVCIWTSVVSDF